MAAGAFAAMQLSVARRVVPPPSEEAPMTLPAFDWKTTATIALTVAIVFLMIATATGYLRF